MNTEFGTRSEVSLQLVSWVVWMLSTSNPDQKFFTSEPPLDPPYHTSPMSSDLKESFTPSNSLIDQDEI